MNRRIDRSIRVEIDMVEIADHVGQSNEEIGTRFIQAVENAFIKLSEMPDMGGLMDPSNSRLSGVRVWPISRFENYLIFYRPIIDGILVLRILHGARDIESILGLS